MSQVEMQLVTGGRLHESEFTRARIMGRLLTGCLSLGLSEEIVEGRSIVVPSREDHAVDARSVVDPVEWVVIQKHEVGSLAHLDLTGVELREKLCRVQG